MSPNTEKNLLLDTVNNRSRYSCLVFIFPKRRVEDLFMQCLAWWNLRNKLRLVTSDEVDH